MISLLDSLDARPPARKIPRPSGQDNRHRWDFGLEPHRFGGREALRVTSARPQGRSLFRIAIAPGSRRFCRSPALLYCAGLPKIHISCALRGLDCKLREAEQAPFGRGGNRQALLRNTARFASLSGLCNWQEARSEPWLPGKVWYRTLLSFAMLPKKRTLALNDLYIKVSPKTWESNAWDSFDYLDYRIRLRAEC